MGLGRYIDAVRRPLRQTRNYVRHFPHRGQRRSCPICKKSSRAFGTMGTPPRNDAMCMYCGAVERHRLTWVYLDRRTDLFNGKSKTMLHVAPEPFFEERLRNLINGSYLTADLLNPRAMVKMDITDIQYPDDTFDVVYCSHVLEHVPDDNKAMRELRRVMKPDGWAILMVPITADKTFEDPTITDPAERLKAFGQEDHVRRYGPDYLDRLREAGFSVKVTRAQDFLAEEDIVRMGIDRHEEIFHCTK